MEGSYVPARGMGGLPGRPTKSANLADILERVLDKGIVIAGDMLLNAAYVVESAKVERLHELVAELSRRHRGLGARLELTGPWPPYNFVPGTESALA